MTPEERLADLLTDARPTAPTEGSEVESEMRRMEPEGFSPVTIRTLFVHQDVHPVVLDFALLRTFGVAWHGWEAETLWTEIHRAFKTQISEIVRAKVMAVKTCHVSTGPWESWQVFEKVIQVLNNNLPRWDLMQAPGIEQLYAGIDIMDTLEKRPFSDEVKLYIAAACHNEDVLFLPSPLDFVQVEVSQPHYICQDCGNEDSALFHDGICDTCTEKWTGGTMGGRPDTELLAQGKGRNLKTVLRFDPDSTQTLWDTVKGKKTADVADLLDETSEGTQVAKLLMARDYLNIRRRQLADQLTSLKSWLGSE